MYSLLLKYGRFLVLVEVLSKNVPGLFVNEYLNSFLPVTSDTTNEPLYPEVLIPEELFELKTLIISTFEPTLRLCGSSVVIVA